MSGIEGIGLVLGAIGTGVQMLGQVQAGKAANQAAKYQAQQLEVNAGQARAAAQREAVDRRRQATIVASRAQAVGAASGGVFDPSTANIISGIEGEGEYGALASLYQGEEAARGNIAQARATRFEGKQAQRQGYYNAVGTAGSFFAKYGSEMFGSASPSAASPAPAYNSSQYGPYQLPWLG